MKNTLVLLSAVAALTSFSQDVEPISEKAVEVANADVTVRVDAKKLLKEAFRQFADEAGIEYGVVMADGRTYSKGQSPVDADATSPQFVKSRTMTYERAYMSALSQFVMDFYGSQTTEKIAEYFADNSSSADSTPVRKAKGIGEKIALLADAKLDNALAREGVDPDKYKGATIAEKRDLLRDSIVTHVASRALHASSGCIPVKTFEAKGEDGRYYIGVVVRYDRISKTLASCFASKTRPVLSKAGGLTVKEALPPEEEMTQNFGVRLYFDETGTPALLSFGQYGSSYTGKSAAMADRAEEHALRQAKALADSGLTAFINSFMDVSEESSVGEELTESKVFLDDGSVSEETSTNVIDVYRKNMKLVGRDTMAGRSTAYEELVEHPSGQKVAVVVRRWSFGMADSVRNIDREPEKRAKENDPTAEKEASSVKKGRTYDF